MGKFLDGIIGRYTDGGAGINNLDFSNIAKDFGSAAAIYGIVNPNNSEGLGNFFGTGGQQQPVGYMGGIPNYTAARELAPNAFTQNTTNPAGEIVPRRPGSMGRRYFTDTKFEQSTDEPFMGSTAEQIAAQNQAAIDDQALFESIYGTVGDQRIAGTGNRQDNEEGYINFDDFDITGGTPTPAAPPPAGTEAAGTAAAAVAAPPAGTAAVAAPPAGTETAGTAPAGVNPPTELQKFNTFLTPFYGKTLTNQDLLALSNSGYNVDQLAAGLKIAGGGQTLFDAITSANNLTNAFNTSAGDYTENTAIADTTTTADTTTATSTGTNDLLDASGNILIPDPIASNMALVADYGWVNNGDGTISDPDGRSTRGPDGKEISDYGSLRFSNIEADNDYTLSDVGAAANIINNTPSTVGDAAEYFSIPETEVQAIIDSYNANPFGSIPSDGDYTQAEAQAAAQLISQNPNLLGEAARYFGMKEKDVQDIVNSLYPNTFAQGGAVGGQGYYLGGTTDGMADQIPATIDNAQPAALSDGEFVIPADVVSHLGNGNSDAGAQNLYSMMDRIRTDRTGNPNQGRQIDPNKYLA
tara:strand:+ start:2080 stop:3825 length:1746 start_codon:yes stop_codon:yes gene_type:complete